MEKLSKKYGFFTAVSMVVGIVIGSGVFKSAGSVLSASGGNLKVSILAWAIGGGIMIVSAYAFSLVAVTLKENNGIADFIEDAFGEKVAYIVAWFMNFIYFPTLTGILAWLAGSVTSSILGYEDTVNGLSVWLFGLGYFILTYLLNLLTPVIAGKWQVSATVIKLIPVFLIAIVGLIIGTVNGNISTNFSVIAENSGAGSLVKAVAVTAFAYEGWILALSIAPELKNAKRNLPLALVLGSLIVAVAYLLFYIGLSGVLSNEEAIQLSGSLDTSVLAAKRLFGAVLGSTVNVLILVSVLGTLNGLIMGGSRGMYNIALKGRGPKPVWFLKVSKYNVPSYSLVISMVFSLLWGLLWFGNFNGLFNGFMDVSILPIVFLYGSYILVYFNIMINMKNLNVINRFIVPVLSTGGALYLIYGSFISDPLMFIYFSLIVLVIISFGVITYYSRA